MSFFRRRLMMGKKKTNYLYYYPLIQQSATAASPNMVFLSQIEGFTQNKQYRIRMNYYIKAYRTNTNTAYSRIYIVNAGAFSFVNLKLHQVPTTVGEYEYSGSIDTIITATLTGNYLTLGGRFDGQASDFTLTEIYIEEVSA